MGEHADDAINDSIDNENRWYDFSPSNCQDEAMMELYAEFGIPNEVNLMGVEDAQSLNQKLKFDSLYFENAVLRSRIKAEQPVQKWFSNGKAYLPSEMDTQHLINALAYAKRTGTPRSAIIIEMEQELEGRDK